MTQHIVTTEGDALKPLWACFSDSPGTTVEGKFNGRVLHSASRADALGFIDGFSDLICQSERDAGEPSLEMNTWMNQVQSNIAIYSGIKSEPFLGFSCRLGASFHRGSSRASMKLSNLDSPSTQPFEIKFGHEQFVFSGPGINPVDMLEVPEFGDLAVRISNSTRYLTGKIDFYITAKLLDYPVTSPRARYRTQAAFVVKDEVFQVYDLTRLITFRDRYTTTFNCYTKA